MNTIEEISNIFEEDFYNNFVNEELFDSNNLENSNQSFEITNFSINESSLENNKSLTCYICQDENEDFELFAPESICECKGSLRIHKSCFNILPNKKECSICKHKFNIPENSYRLRNGSLEVVEEMYEYGSKMVYQLNKNNQMEGVFIIYYDNGNIWEISQYKNGKMIGERTLYNRIHTKKIVETYDENGVKMFSTQEIPIQSTEILV